MGIIELHNNERTAIIEGIMKCFDKTEVYLWLPAGEPEQGGKLILPIPHIEQIHDLLKVLDKSNLQAILGTYKISDIHSIIMNLAFFKLSYDNVRKTIMDDGENKQRLVSAGVLSQFLSEAELNELANLILNEIVNPKTYYALILLPLVDIPDNIKINNVFSLIRATPDITDNFLTDDPVTEEKTYLLIKQQGVRPVGLLKKPLLLDYVESNLKVLLGLCLAQEIFEKSEKSPDKIFWGQKKPKVEETTKFIEIFEIEQQYELDEDVYEIDEFADYKSGKYKFNCLTNPSLRDENVHLINLLTISRSATEPVHKLKMVKGGNAEKVAKSEELKLPVEVLKEIFDKKIRNVLDSGDKYGEAIKTASEWYFEALCNENETFKFIQYTIAIESLLGDPKKQDRVTERLSDRCAYLLGDNQKEREEIKASFEKIYAIRSKIIHRRSLRIPEEDSRFLPEAETLTKRLIRKEIDLYNLLVDANLTEEALGAGLFS